MEDVEAEAESEEDETEENAIVNLAIVSDKQKSIFIYNKLEKAKPQIISFIKVVTGLAKDEIEGPVD